jgi:hypothetical protein
MLGAGAGTGFGAGGFFGAAAFGAAAFGAAAFGAAAFGAAAFRAAFAFGFAFLADFLAALFFFATTRFFLRAGAAFTRFFAFLVFDFAFFAFFAMIASRSLRLRIRFANTTHLANTAASPAALETRLPANASGAGPPVAQSTSSTV